MWAAALAKQEKAPEVSVEAEASETEAIAAVASDAKAAEKPKPVVLPAWAPPKIAPTCVFDLRRKGIEWEEKSDFDDTVWRDGLGRSPVKMYYRSAMPLSLVAAISLVDLDLESQLTVHCLLDGNSAPFAEPHDWGIVLQRLPQLKSLMIVYIDLGTVDKKSPKGAQMPYGTLLRPVEEAKVGERMAHSSRFLGTYKEFREHTRELPRIVQPGLALWADAPLVGSSDDELSTRVEALSMLAGSGVPVVITQESEIPEHGGAPGGPWLSDSARQSLAVLELGMGAKVVQGWYWNRFVIPLDQTERGILAAHAVLGVIRPKGAKATGATAKSVKKALRDHSVEASAVARVAGLGPPTAGDAQALKLQWAAFCENLRRSGRPVGPDLPEAEKKRQMLEFQEFCRAFPAGRSPMM